MDVEIDNILGKTVSLDYGQVSFILLHKRKLSAHRARWWAELLYLILEAVHERVCSGCTDRDEWFGKGFHRKQKLDLQSRRVCLFSK